jgi:hypothetical protein
MSLQVTYRDGAPFAAYIGLGRRLGEQSVRTELMGPDLVVDFGADGRPLGIEVIDPPSTTAEDIFAVFDRLGLGRPSRSALSPLLAA